MCVKGLRARPEHNGHSGQVRSFDTASRRYVLEMADGRQISVREENVSPLPQPSVERPQHSPTTSVSEMEELMLALAISRWVAVCVYVASDRRSVRVDQWQR